MIASALLSDIVNRELTKLHEASKVMDSSLTEGQLKNLEILTRILKVLDVDDDRPAPVTAEEAAEALKKVQG